MNNDCPRSPWFRAPRAAIRGAPHRGIHPEGLGAAGGPYNARMPDRRDLILLVEDDANDELLTTRTLRKQGLDNPIQVVRDGAEALDFLFARGSYTSRAGQPAPRLVLLDLKLPKRSGLEVLKEVRAEPGLRGTPVVVFTSSARDLDVAAAYASGASSYVIKPIDPEQFREAVHALGLFWLQTNVVPEG
jgi:two-component system response regulator